MGSHVFEDSYYAREPIAIVGSSCRFPGGASSVSKLWDLLKDPHDFVQEIPPNRFSTKAFHHIDNQHHGSANVRHAYLLQEDPRVFDRDFFGINPKEAESMDPQQRILLETVYEGIESAGYSIQQLRGSSTGVFVGVMSFDYQFIAMRGLDSLPQYHATGGAMSILANRVSYFYDWRGPSVAVDTACSSSLVAMHQAVLALRNGESKMAIAAGANLILGPEPFIAESKLNMLSPNGRSYMWDAAADGYTRGEGFSVVVLKTLSQALADQDHIECIIRETGVNSDGRTPGITMPSSDAQAALIRSTYERCGLDPTSERDRPQYFEAHGTGTPTGDPIEARAIHSVFFPGEPDQKGNQLLVGSIKTIIGHTEGTAGLAGVLKASLAVQHGLVPANLHFQELNPRIRPFYSHLHVPTAMTPWPAISEGSPRRVSVNSFGFGGTNAHAIIESWNGPSIRDAACASKGHGGGLFVMSANSSQALAARAAALVSYLREYPNTDLGRLAYTLFQRSSFPFRAAFSATSAAQLVKKLEANMEALKGSPRITAIPESLPPRILGVFTGQGAQWATMGRELYQASDVFRGTIDQLQRSLDGLPDEDRPDWALIDELCAPAETSRVGTASISQPLCTALQVALVDLLHAAGVEFAAVVGHSSGEIGAAYAAGYLNAHDAICIAYYRGVHSHLAQGPRGKRGKMMAVGMSMDQASRFCGEFGGALRVAASNSQRSCTLAGDAEAVEEAQSRLQNGTFVRMLEVDTAYHSHHMQPCAAPYLQSMQKCGIKVQKGPKSCSWYSSVWGSNGRSRSFDNEDELLLLEGQYWVDNLTQTVLFSQALNRAVTEEHCFDLVLEIGPHPALRGPSSETIKALTRQPLPYSGVLRRGEGAVEAFSDALGLMWKSFPSQRPRISIRRAFPNASPKRLVILKDLPTYPWDHGNIIWHESRASRIFRTQSEPLHELLGHAVIHGDRQRREMHWRQVLKLSEIPWLRGHKILDQCLFPATGYVTMAYEAARRLVGEDQAVRLIELHDIEIHRPMNLEEESTGLEVFFILRITTHTDEFIAAEFACYSSPVDASHPEETLAPGSAQLSGSVRLLLGVLAKDALPRRTTPQLPLGVVDMEAFYSSLSDLGYGYTADFRAPSMLRRLNHAVVSVPCFAAPSLTRVDMHPATLDTAIHGIYAGVTSPGDGSLRSVYLPTRIDCIRVNMAAESDSRSLAADSFVTLADAKTVSGDIDVFNSADGNTQVQIRGVHMMAVPGSQKRDRQLYAMEIWERDASYGIDPKNEATVSKERHKLTEVVARATFFYCRKLRDQIKPFEVMLMGKQRRNLMNWVLKDLLPKVEAGQHPEAQQAWLDDTEDIIERCRAEYHDTIDMAVIHALGQSLPKIVRGMAQPLKLLAKDGMLDRLYSDGLGFQEANKDLGTLVRQLSHQCPRMKVLELGAGSGVTTRNVLASMANRYASYTCTDISAEALPREAFNGYRGRLTFSVLDIGKDPTLQGHSEATFDLIIASNTLYSAQAVEEALRNCHRLLRPGGHLVLLEMTRDYLPVRFIRSLLPGSWLSSEALSEVVKGDDWDAFLRKTGFSGVDTSSSPSFCSVMLSQAVDNAVQFLRDPLSDTLQMAPRLCEVVLVGSPTSCAPVTRLALQTQECLVAVSQTQITLVVSVAGIQVSPGASVLLLCDLDVPIFDNMNEEQFLGLQEIARNAGAVLWVTSGATTGENPKATMAVGWGRSVRAERPDLKLQFLDIEDPEAVKPSMLAAHLLRLACQDQPAFEEALWTYEPELRLREGALHIPRVRPLDNLSRLSNIRALEVTQSAAVRDAGTTVIVDDHGDIFQAQVYQRYGEISGQNQLCLQVSASSFGTLRCQDGGSAHIVIGRDTLSGQKLLALSSTNGSTITIPETDVLYRWATAVVPDDCVQLHLILTALIAESVLEGAEGLAWVHGAPVSLSRALQLVASQHKIGLHQTRSDAGRDDGIPFIHPYITERDLQLVQPRDVQTFISFDQPPNNSLSSLVRTSLPNLNILRKGVATASRDGIALGFDRATLGTLAKNHASNDSLRQGPYGEHVHKHIIGIHEVASRQFENSGSAMKVIDWNASEMVPAKVLPPRHDGLFSPAKTYLLFGLSGDVGISICHWMIDHGARNVVLASRKPTIGRSVIEYMSRKGATVHAMAVDICDRSALLSVYAKIEATMPPVGGVMNGAAAWRDRLFINISWADFAAVLAPKVQGTENLARLLEEKKVELDFFTLFSSVVAVAGNAGQTAYAAANLFMEGVVRERRRRGLPASIVHIGHLAGLGYVHRHDRRSDVETALHQTMDALSETDLHDALAEAIMGGRPGSQRPAELVVGLKSGIKASWRQQPRLQHYLASDEGADEDSGEGANGHASIKAQLAAAREDQDTCLSLLITGFSSAVGAMLYMKPSEVDRTMSVANLGIDSLVAIRMRDWFLQEVGVEVSVIKVLSVNTSLTELCQDVLAAWRRLGKETRA